MRRLPNVYPADTTTWPNSEGTFDVGAAANNSKILMRNLTPLNLRLDFYNGSTDVLSAWEHNVWPLDGDSPTIGWSIDPDSPSVIAPPSNVVYLTLFDSTEKVPGTYPVFSVLQTSEGTPGGVQANVTQLVNTGNVANTNVVTVNSTSAPGSTVTLSNDGLFQLLVTIAGALVNAIKTQEVEPILQLGALTHLVEILGNLQIDGNLNGAFTVSVNNVHGEFKAVPAGGLYFVDAGNNVRIACDTDNTFVEAGTGNVQLQAPAGTSQVTVASALTTVSNALALLSTLLLNNNTAIQAKDTLGTAQNAFMVDGSNYPGIRGFTQHDEVRMWDHLGNLNAWFNTGGGGINAGTFQTPRLLLSSGSIAHFDKTHFTAAAGTYPTTKTYSHGLSYTPDFIIIMPGENVASFGSCTIGVWNWNATTFDVTLGAQINFQAFFIKLNV